MKKIKVNKKLLIELLFICGWTVLLLYLFLDNEKKLESELVKLAETEAEVAYQKDILYRRWNAEHGGVYVPLDSLTKPNQYLNVSERDVTTTSGKKLTLVNPAFMTRQVYELTKQKTGIIGHMTSLNPINPVNNADDFEKMGLLLFELGYDQFYKIVHKEKESYFRLLKPFVTEKSCLQCHEHQGYKVGDIRGGISVSVPLSHFDSFRSSQSEGLIWGYIIIWIIGLTGIHFGFVIIRKNQAEVEKSRKQWMQLFKKSIDPVILFANDGAILETNDAFTNITGFSYPQATKMKIADICNAPLFSNVQQIEIDEKEKISFTDTIRSKTNTDISVEFHIGKIFIEQTYVFLAIIIDIRQRIAQEKKIKESENRYKTLFENDTDAIIILEENKIQGCNPRAEALFHTNFEAIKNKSPFDFSPEYQPDGKHSEQKAGEYLNKVETQGRQFFEWKHELPDGTIFYTDITLIPLNIGGKKLIQARFHDMTKRKSIEIEKTKLHNELIEKNRELEQIVYITSHDLRSPLVNIQGFSSEAKYSLEDIKKLLQQSDNIPEKAKQEIAEIINDDIYESFGFIDKSITKMDSLLSGLLKISRLGRIKLSFTKINMNMLLTEVVALYEFSIKEKNAAIFLDELEDCYSDEEQVNQVFSNLLGNALKYSRPDVKPMVKISSRVDNNKVIYYVKDNGVGISEANQAKIFDIFHRVNQQETEGEGLGLTIIKKILNRLNGEISVTSEEGKGSTFSIILPHQPEGDAFVEF